jgi:flagellin-like protein
MGNPFYQYYQSQKGGIKEKMNTIRKMKKNAKALSPVVASIILIAVTVAVSIAVAAWMGALVVGQMDTEQIQMGTPTFAAGAAGTGNVTIAVKNSGTSALVLSNIYLNGNAVVEDDLTSASEITALPYTLAANAQVTLSFDATIVTGNNYEVKVVTAKNNPFLITALAPA